MLVSVPKILDVLREHVAAASRRRRASAAGAEAALSRGAGGATAASIALFGLKFWAFVVGAAPLDAELEAFWGELGFVVIQGYGLTETAPIVTPESSVRHEEGLGRQGDRRRRGEDRRRRRDPRARRERDDAATSTPPEETARAFEDGWFHTGDIGELGADGQLFIRGRKKEMIVTPEGLNVFPEDVERVLNACPGVRDSAVVGVADRIARSACTRCSCSSRAPIPTRSSRAANAQLDDHQQIRRALVWPEPELPRTEGTRKLKRAAIRDWVTSGARAAARSQPAATRSRRSIAQVRRPRRSVAARRRSRSSG